jgi:hypothetical protein
VRSFLWQFFGLYVSRRHFLSSLAPEVVSFGFAILFVSTLYSTHCYGLYGVLDICLLGTGLGDLFPSFSLYICIYIFYIYIHMYVCICIYIDMYMCKYTYRGEVLRERWQVLPDHSSPGWSRHGSSSTQNASNVLY